VKALDHAERQRRLSRALWAVACIALVCAVVLEAADRAAALRLAALAVCAFAAIASALLRRRARRVEPPSQGEVPTERAGAIGRPARMFAAEASVAYVVAAALAVSGAARVGVWVGFLFGGTVLLLVAIFVEWRGYR
jgi:lysylphosphatidylglycerol synthetase-like protein (DUF2156 family)